MANNLALNVAVEVLCTSSHRMADIILPPSYIKEALVKDISDTKSLPPSIYECETLVECVLDGLEPEWHTNRWPRTLGLISHAIRTL